MRIGELAARAGLEVPTIRYYESLGLMAPAPRSSSGYRQYASADLERLAFIKHNQALGFTLREIALLTPLHSIVSRPAAQPPPTSSQELQSIVTMLEGKRGEIDTKMVELRKLRRSLVRAIAHLMQPAAICPASAHLAKRR